MTLNFWWFFFFMWRSVTLVTRSLCQCITSLI